MLFAFHLGRGRWARCTITVRQSTATKAIASLRRMTHSGCTPCIALRDVDKCTVAEAFEHSPTDAELVRAAESITSYFWRELHHRVDVTVHMLDED